MRDESRVTRKPSVGHMLIESSTYTTMRLFKRMLGRARRQLHLGITRLKRMAGVVGLVLASVKASSALEVGNLTGKMQGNGRPA